MTTGLKVAHRSEGTIDQVFPGKIPKFGNYNFGRCEQEKIENSQIGHPTNLSPVHALYSTYSIIPQNFQIS